MTRKLHDALCVSHSPRLAVLKVARSGGWMRLDNLSAGAESLIVSRFGSEDVADSVSTALHDGCSISIAQREPRAMADAKSVMQATSHVG